MKHASTMEFGDGLQSTYFPAILIFPTVDTRWRYSVLQSRLESRTPWCTLARVPCPNYAALDPRCVSYKVVSFFIALQEALSNVVENALKYCGMGGTAERPTVVLRARPSTEAEWGTDRYS